MTRTMYDAVTPGNIPASATLVAGYADGRYANLSALKKRFPHATIVEIAISHLTRAQVLDVESGDASPEGAVQWCTTTMHDVPNTQLTVYCNASTWPAVKAAFRSAGVSQPQYWIAQYDGKSAIPSGAIAKQHTNTAKYDLSSVVAAGSWHGVDPVAPPKPKVSLKNLIAAAKRDPGLPQGGTTHPADVRIYEAALKAEGLLASKYASDGSFGSTTVKANSAWQKAYSSAHHLGWSGADVNGIPGPTSAKALGDKHGFTVA